MTPKFSIIIPTCRRDDALVACLQRLAPGTQSGLSAAYEIVVTDDGQQESTREAVERSGAWSKLARWVRGPAKGPAANRNNGAFQSRGEWLVFTDDDCLPDATWLGAFHRTIAAQPDLRVLEGRTYADRPRRSFAEISPINERGGLLWSCNMSVKRSLFDAMRGFDERFPFAAMEDVDFKYRLDLAKERIEFVPEAGVCHPWRKDAGWKGLMQHEQSTLIYLGLHPEEFQRLNAAHFLKCFARLAIKDTIPGILKYRGRGLHREFLRLTALLRAAWRVRAARRKLPSVPVRPSATPLPESASGILKQ